MSDFYWPLAVVILGFLAWSLARQWLSAYSQRLRFDGELQELRRRVGEFEMRLS